MRKSARSFYRPHWKDRLTFTLRERRGLYVLALILFIEAGVLHYLRYFYEPLDKSDWLELISQADSILASRKSGVRSYVMEGDAATQSKNTGKRKLALHPFDPNRCTSEDWRSLGLTARQSEAVIKYVRRSGGFKSADELRKVRVVPTDLMDAWMPFIQFPSEPDRQPIRKNTAYNFTIEINTADSADFERLRGIGPSMAGRIVHYRLALGGFVEINQLKEVYGFSDSLYKTVSACITLDTAFKVRRLDLNRSPADSLRRHPYIGYRLSSAIDKYRSQHPFRDLEELNRLPLVTPEYFRKFAPYFKVGE